MLFRTMSILLPVVFAFIGQKAFAVCDGVGCSDVKLEMIYVTGGRSYIQTDGNETNLDNCIPDSGTMAILDHSHSSADKIYALLLTAYTRKLNVRLRFYDTTGNTGLCSINYAVLENN